MAPCCGSEYSRGSRKEEPLIEARNPESARSRARAERGYGGDDRAAYAQIDLRDVDAAEAVIFFAESPEGSRTRGGKHVEFGYALAKGKRIFLIGKPVNVFHHLPEVVQRINFEDVIPLLSWVEQLTKSVEQATQTPGADSSTPGPSPDKEE